MTQNVYTEEFLEKASQFQINLSHGFQALHNAVASARSMDDDEIIIPGHLYLEGPRNFKNTGHNQPEPLPRHIGKLHIMGSVTLADDFDIKTLSELAYGVANKIVIDGDVYAGSNDHLNKIPDNVKIKGDLHIKNSDLEVATGTVDGNILRSDHL